MVIKVPKLLGYVLKEIFIVKGSECHPWTHELTLVSQK